ncbi:MAG: helix-turn-helix domain-containing protein [Candidatus Brocadiales bacterium]|nr:helix-turn-helix domain-containing protein [Candidatus Bathyanammoxibius amoris]
MEDTTAAQEPILTIGEVAKMLHTDPYRIRYLLVRGHCPDVQQLANRRVFSAKDVYRVKKALEDTNGTRHGEGR